METNDQALRFIDVTRRIAKTSQQHKFRGLLYGEAFIVQYLLDCEQPAAPGEISEKTSTSTARTAAALNNLENKGIIKREINKQDRRKIMVSLTDKGRTAGQLKKDEFIADVGNVMKAIGREDSEELIRIFEKICAFAESKEKLRAQDL